MIVAKDNSEANSFQAQFAYILDLSADAIISVDSSQTILTFNRGAEEIFGYNKEDIIGENLTKLIPDRFNKKHPDYVKEFEESSVKSKFMGERSEVFGLKKDGEEFFADITISKIDTESGRIFVAVVRDVSEKKEREKRLQNSLKEKEYLLQEVHHRVKNNLQVISSLLNLQINTLDNLQAEEAVKDAHARVKSIALIHEHLYESEHFSDIKFSEYIRKLADNLLLSFGNSKHQLKVSINDEAIPLVKAVPAGLIVNELLTNSLKHAFGQTDKGIIEINFIKSDNQFILEVSDNGKGLPESFQIDKSDTLGVKLIANLTSQIDGKLELLNNNPGVLARITFPAEVVN